jgi:hypothetical protein
MVIKRRDFLIGWEISLLRHFYLERVAGEILGGK